MIKSIEFISYSSKKTFEAGLRIGRILNCGIIIAMTGDLGAGKTAFVQGLARGLDVPEKYYITSPTYTLINEYPGRYPFFHIDLYRLESEVDFEDIGLFDIFQTQAVAAVEWADRLHKDVLTDYLSIHIEVLTDLSRNIRISAYGSHKTSLIYEIDNILKDYHLKEK
ncbi:tRNA threonylcarbamoyl adenosine modification protein [Desulfonema limicola]|uniref:tRNA threonylcarbamoyladenosine biosynthesis protein TsaE n=1 Tax=Desulfonema limicola TaxID=45656 RepID=A0A975GJ08_9BACT|nr:tRNA (adenosine(37)-N6)-threonylcarbamoyltransferase complex ATPase subunit type 1 TsaE [Desulfonema limicola]QTA82483.1 tRNA threonylcarbamoyl adenosine modification protein [Desulfonema limicola]